jgi:hypothetical protein
MATCPSQRVPTRVRQRRGVSVTARHLTPALSTVPPAFRPPRTAQVAAARVHRLAPYPHAAVVRRRNQFLSSPSQQPSSSHHFALSLAVCLYSKRRAPPLGAIATSSCAYVSSLTRGQLGPRRPPLRADRTPHDATLFLDGMSLIAVSHLRPWSKAISFLPKLWG